ncbi:hypothetical protein BJ508DRAFT_23731 [Ascobolus immersus RN42]|uniref:Uncharacterized protein n=1 Tax=Ascobolus immersus RN42 TaxID=1160509 RepID=A0A3N4HT38_ASCIM|nr:hypothetical protein BJ508DRAFT_23731 [Ascobolus immersus RN42]
MLTNYTYLLGNETPTAWATFHRTTLARLGDLDADSASEQRNRELSTPATTTWPKKLLHRPQHQLVSYHNEPQLQKQKTAKLRSWPKQQSQTGNRFTSILSKHASILQWHAPSTSNHSFDSRWNFSWRSPPIATHSHFFNSAGLPQSFELAYTYTQPYSRSPSMAIAHTTRPKNKRGLRCIRLRSLLTLETNIMLFLHCG